MAMPNPFAQTTAVQPTNAPQPAYQAPAYTPNPTYDGQKANPFAAPAAAAAAPAQGGVVIPVQEMTLGQKILYYIDRISMWLSILPMVVAACLKDVNFRVGLIIALIIVAINLLLGLVLLLTKRRRTWPRILEIGLGCVLGIILGFSYLSESVTQRFFNFLQAGGMALVVLASLGFKYPFVVQYARDINAPAVISIAEFYQLCVILTWVWFGVFCTCSGSALIPAIANENSGFGFINVFFNYVIPAVALLIGFAANRWYPRWYFRNSQDPAIKDSKVPVSF